MRAWRFRVVAVVVAVVVAAAVFAGSLTTEPLADVGLAQGIDEVSSPDLAPPAELITSPNRHVPTPVPDPAPERSWTPIEPSREEVVLEVSEDVAGDAARRVAAPGGTVSVAAVDRSGTGHRVEVEVVEAEIADRVGADGVLLRVADLTTLTDESVERSAGVESLEGRGGVGSKEATVSLSVDFTGVAGRFGGNYADRLQLRVLPACAFEVPVPRGCEADGVLLESVTDFETGRISAEVAVPAARADRLVSAATVAPGAEKDDEPLEAPDEGGVSSSATTSTTIPLPSSSSTSSSTTVPSGDRSDATAADPVTLTRSGGHGVSVVMG